MKDMKHVWIVAVAVAVAAAAVTVQLWVAIEPDVRAGTLVSRDVSNMALGAWVMLTGSGAVEWMGPVLVGLAAGVVAFLVGWSSVKQRRAQETVAVTAAARPHPMD